MSNSLYLPSFRMSGKQNYKLNSSVELFNSEWKMMLHFLRFLKMLITNVHDYLEFYRPRGNNCFYASISFSEGEQDVEVRMFSFCSFLSLYFKVCSSWLWMSREHSLCKFIAQRNLKWKICNRIIGFILFYLFKGK